MGYYCMNSCEHATSKIKCSFSALTTTLSAPSKIHLSKPTDCRFFYDINAAKKKRLLSLQSSVVSARNEQVGYGAEVKSTTEEGFFCDRKIGKRSDLEKILILGAGPSVVGQTGGFDYAGSQACKALREEGYVVIVMNSNPVTIMTDPEMADRTYIEPMTPELVEQVIKKERPDALLSTVGGQTALNLAVVLSERGVLEKYGVELIGAKLDAIKKAEDRDLFKRAMKKIGIKTPPSGIGTTLEECIEIAYSFGEFPLIIRPSFTMEGTGGGIAYNREEFEAICRSGLAASLTSQVLVAKPLFGWKEYEMEVMRDSADNVIIICSIENIDPMGVHTGDSIAVAPAQTLMDKESQRLRDYSAAIVREIGVDGGGSNIQFAVNPKDGEVMVIEMNPRISRSSAMASKATGFPLAKMAAKLSVGYSLDQIPIDITNKTPAIFDLPMDYVVTKIPRFDFEKFPKSESILTTQMKSVGESMAIGSNFQESFQKALRSLGCDYLFDCGYSGWDCDKLHDFYPFLFDIDFKRLEYNLRVPTAVRMCGIRNEMKNKGKVNCIHELSLIDEWFLTQLRELLDAEQYMCHRSLSQFTKDDFLEVKRRGFSDKQIAFATSSTEKEVRLRRLFLGVRPAYKRVDTCVTRSEVHSSSSSSCMYSSYDYECESLPNQRKKVLILGAGPNQIGQGSELDFCCCHASFALQSVGYETIIINSNPETVSTNYDTGDRLYFEPLTVENIVNIIDLEQPDGIIMHFGGRNSQKLALSIQTYLKENKIKSRSGTGFVRIWGTPLDSIDIVRNMERFDAMLKELEIKQQVGLICGYVFQLLDIQDDWEFEYPIVLRSSYNLGGQIVEIFNNPNELEAYNRKLEDVDSSCRLDDELLVAEYLSDTVEVDVIALADLHGNVVICGIMEHIGNEWMHYADSTCMIPTKTISQLCLDTIRTWTTKLAKRLNLCGLVNFRYQITSYREVFFLGTNLCASSFVPFVSKAIGHPLAKYDGLVLSGKSLHDLNFTEEVVLRRVSIKQVIFPFENFRDCGALLSPHMHSTGEVMGVYFESSIAFAKAQMGIGQKLPLSGTVFFSLNDFTKYCLEIIAKAFVGLGFRILSTCGTARVLESMGVPVEKLLKMHEGQPHAGNMIASGQIQLVVITDTGNELDLIDGRKLRRMAFAYKIPIVTTVAAALETAEAISSLKNCYKIEPIALQDRC